MIKRIKSTICDHCEKEIDMDSSNKYITVLLTESSLYCGNGSKYELDDRDYCDISCFIEAVTENLK